MDELNDIRQRLEEFHKELLDTLQTKEGGEIVIYRDIAIDLAAFLNAFLYD